MSILYTNRILWEVLLSGNNSGKLQLYQTNYVYIIYYPDPLRGAALWQGSRQTPAKSDQLYNTNQILWEVLLSGKDPGKLQLYQTN